MTSQRSLRQPDLFAPLEVVRSRPQMPAEFVQRIRSELHGTLARASTALTMPWSDLTQATLAELRFQSIADWLPIDEADSLRASFKIEMERLYKIASEQYDREHEAAP